MKAVRVHRFGGPEVLQFEDVPLPEPGPGEARVRMEYAGVNFIDIYHRTGLYPSPLPFTPGVDGAGVVDAVGPDVNNVQKADRVAYAMSTGSYAEMAIIDAWKLVPVPEGMDLGVATAAMVQGLTAHYLTRSTFRITPEHTVLVHAAAGGVGLLLVQLAKRIGARVIGTVSTAAKAQAAKAAGIDEAIVYTEQDFETEVKRMTAGRGVDVVYDSVAKATFEKSLKCLVPRGMLVLYGQSSGPVTSLDPLLLAKSGSLFLTRPTLGHYCRDRKELLERAEDVFSWIASKQLKITIHREFPLHNAGDAHRLLEQRQTSGKLLLRA